MVNEKHTHNTDFEVHEKNHNYTNTNFGVHGISQIQFTIKYHTPLHNTGYNQTDGLNIMA